MSSNSMKVVIAIDSFKGSLSSMEAGNAASLGVTTLEEAMDVETAKKNMTLAVEQVFRLL